MWSEYCEEKIKLNSYEIKYRTLKDSGYFDITFVETVKARDMEDAIEKVRRKCFDNYATFEPLEVRKANDD